MSAIRTPRLALLAAAVFSCCLSANATADPRHPKVDRALRHLVDAGGQRTQQVIITVNPGCRAAVRDAMVTHGDTVRSEHGIIDAVSGEIHSRDVDELAKSPCVKAVSSDAPVEATASVRSVSRRWGAWATVAPPAV